MTSNDTKCIILLSDKSSGSSALQYLIEMFPNVSLITKTRHSERETLYWTKAASILGLPQVNMLESEVPIPPQKALQDLKTLLSENLPDIDFKTEDPHELIFGGWERLCNQFAPVLLEKSPHHLHQWSALELLHECSNRLGYIDFLFIGLIRNPMDTLYSQWRRWKAIPERTQYQWKKAYENLIRFKKLVGDKLIIVRYEDLIDNGEVMNKLFKFIDKNHNHLNGSFHSKSLQKWRKDLFFGFQISPQVIDLAESFGYQKKDMLNKRKSIWPVYRIINRYIYKISNPWL